ncbi:unnamed protein product, partial [Rotaria magnacalcarata]
MNRALEQREVEIEQQIIHFRDKLEQANLETQHVKSQLVELQDRDQTQNMTMNDREIHYQSQIKELQT